MTRVVQTGNYNIQKTVATSSPAMDIQKASNFERYLYYLSNQDSERVLDFIQQLQEKKSFQLDNFLEKSNTDRFFERLCNAERSRKDNQKTLRKRGLFIGTHTAVGVSVAEKLNLKRTICLATAHPAKDYQPIEKIIKNHSLVQKKLSYKALQTIAASFSAMNSSIFS